MVGGRGEREENGTECPQYLCSDRLSYVASLQNPRNRSSTPSLTHLTSFLWILSSLLPFRSCRPSYCVSLLFLPLSTLLSFSALAVHSFNHYFLSTLLIPNILLSSPQDNVLCCSALPSTYILQGHPVQSQVCLCAHLSLYL